jgi:serine/threonine protein phosphatase 1
MNRTLVIGDIHGGLRALQQVLKKAGVTHNDELIFLGDYVDGWSESPQVLSFLMELEKTQKCIFIRGNHDALLLQWLLSDNKNTDEDMWYKHGGEATVKAYSKISSETKNSHIEFLKSLENYYLDDQKRLFVHAGFTNMNGVAFEYFPKMFYWERTLWETALALDQDMEKEDLRYPKRLTLYREIYIGHTPVTRIGKTVPVQKACVWNIDTGAAFKGPLTILDVDSKTFWQSDPLPDLYPGEKGRNL